MSQSSPDHGLRPVAAQALEPATTRRPSPTPPGATARETRAVLFPESDPLDEPQPEKTRRFNRIAKPVAYVASALAGAVLVTAIYGLIGPRTGVSSSRAGADSAPPGSAASDTTALDRRADTLALAVSAFDLRARMFDTRRMGCPGLARGLQQVEDGWLAYNMARKNVLAGTDPARDARDKSLYANVRTVEARFERSACARP